MGRNIRQSIGKSFNAKDLGEGPLVLTIKDIKIKVFDDENKKNVVSFEEADKQLILNVTNTNILCDEFGDEDVDWIGRKIELFQGKTQFKGKLVNCVSVRVPKE
jgi:hypothetical protein